MTQDTRTDELHAPTAVLTQAAALIEREGWCKRHFGNYQKDWSAQGTIEHVLGARTCHGHEANRITEEVVAHCEDVCAALSGHIGRDLIDWNSGRSDRGPVVRAMIEAAETASS